MVPFSLSSLFVLFLSFVQPAAAKKYDRSGCDWVSWGSHASQEYQEKFATGRAKYGPGRYKRVLVNFGKVALVKSFGKFRLNGFG